MTVVPKAEPNKGYAKPVKAIDYVCAHTKPSTLGVKIIFAERDS